MTISLHPGKPEDSSGAATASEEWRNLHARVISQIHDAVIVIDRQSHVLCWNPGAERLYGLTADQMLGRKLEESHQIRWLHPGDEEEALNCLERTGGWQGENFHVRKDGQELYVQASLSLLRDEQGAVVGLLAIIRDSTERHRLKQLVEQHQERLMLAQKIARAGWFDWDIRRNALVVSEEAELLHGQAPGTFQGGYAQWKRFVHPDDLAQVEQNVANALRSGGEHSNLHRVLWPDQSVHWLQSRVKVFLDEHSQAERMLGVFLDVTELKEAEEQAQVIWHDLERRVSLRSAALQESRQEMEAFVYSVSHDLRSPLRAMEGFAQAVREDEAGHLSETSQQYLERIQRAARRMDALICGLIDYTRMQHCQMSIGPVALDSVLDAVLLALDKKVAEKQAVVSIRRPLPVVQSHGATLELIISNLISNALKFVASLTRPEILVWAEENAGRIRLNFKDNGIGIEPEHQEKIFRLFERLHDPENYSGLGLGLAIARKGLDRLGGHIGLQSAPGQGSCFWIELPRPSGAGHPAGVS